MLLLTILLSLLPAHDYHVSTTNIRYLAERAEVQVEMQLFVEDLEKDMVDSGAPENLELGTKQEHEEAERYLLAYLEKHFTITWNGETLPLEMVGYELADDLHGFWVYQQALVETGPEKVAIENSLITGTFSDQKNIVKLFNGAERSATLLMSKDRVKAEF